MKKKRTVFTAQDLDGGTCTFTDINAALEFLKYEIEEMLKEDFQNGEIELSIKVHQMTEKEISEMPEYLN